MFICWVVKLRQGSRISSIFLGRLGNPEFHRFSMCKCGVTCFCPLTPHLCTGLGVEGVKVGPATGSTAPLTGFDHLMVPNRHFLSFAFKCYYQRVSLLIMSHLREALQSILFSCCLRRLPAHKSKQQVLKHCRKNHPRVQPPPFCPQLPLCLLISSSDALLEGPSPPSFWRHKELEMKIFLFCAPSYEKWEPFSFPE